MSARPSASTSTTWRPPGYGPRVNVKDSSNLGIGAICRASGTPFWSQSSAGGTASPPVAGSGRHRTATSRAPLTTLRLCLRFIRPPSPGRSGIGGADPRIELLHPLPGRNSVLRRNRDSLSAGDLVLLWTHLRICQDSKREQAVWTRLGKDERIDGAPAVAGLEVERVVDPVIV